MGRDPSRIDPILKQLAILWHRHPDLRLGQIIDCAAFHAAAPDVFCLEDDGMIKGLESVDRLLDLGWRLEEKTNARADADAMEVLIAAVRAGQEARRTLAMLDRLLQRDGLPTLKMRGEWNVGVHASLGFADWPQPLAEVTSNTTGADAIDALAALLEKGDES